MTIVVFAWVQIHPPTRQKYLFGRAFTSCGYKKDIRSKNRAVARFFDARKPGFQKCENVDVSKRKIETNPRNKKKAIAILKSEIAI